MNSPPPTELVQYDAGGIDASTYVQRRRRRLGTAELRGFAVIDRVGRDEEGQEAVMAGTHLVEGYLGEACPGAIDDAETLLTPKRRVERERERERERE